MYEYATGLIRVLEKDIIDQNDLIRMTEAPNSETAFNVLNDTDLKDNILGIPMEQFDRAIQNDNLQLNDAIKQFTDGDNLYKLIFLSEDYFNLKIIFKNIKLGTEFPAKEYSRFGSTKILQLKRAVKSRLGLMPATEEKLDDYWRKSIAGIKKTLRKKRVNTVLDAVIDAAYFKHALTLAKKIGSQILQNFFRLNIDSLNIKTAVRGKKIGLAAKEIKNYLITGGDIKTADITDRVGKEEKELVDFLKDNQSFSKEWEEIFENFQINHDIILLEKKLDIFLLNFLRDAVQASGGGTEIIFYYAYLKKIMNTNIELILTGRINNISDEEIKTRLRA